MIVKYYNGDISISKLAEMSYTNKFGTSAYHLVETLKKIGFESEGIKLDLNELKNYNQFPVIAHTTVNKYFGHFVVIYKIDKNNNFIIGDPSRKIVKIKKEEFTKIYNGIVITAKPIKTIPRYSKNKFVLNYIFNIIINNKLFFILIFIFSILSTILTIFITFYFQFMIDSITNLQINLIKIFMISLFIQLIILIFNYIRNEFIILINKKIDDNLTFNVFKKIMLLPYPYYKNRTTGEVISRITDLVKIKDLISEILIFSIIDFILSLLSGIVIFNINQKLFYFSLIILIVHFILIILFKMKKINKIEKVLRNKDTINSIMIESINGFETIKGLGVENIFINKFKIKFFNYTKEIFSLEKFQNKEIFITNLISNLSFLLIIFLGIILIKNNQLSIGELITIQFLLNLFLEPIKKIINSSTNIFESIESIKRIDEILFIEEEKIELSSFNEIQINCLTYNQGNIKPILNNICLSINKSNKIMLIGKSGSGKSTLLKILKGYYKIEDNHVFIDNIDINKISNENIKDNITLVAEKEILFTDTIYNNILVDRQLNQNEFLEIVDICEINEITKNNNFGINMFIEENGYNLSLGEKERIILARALVNKFKILLIDEGLSQVDTNMERRILKKLFSKYKDKIIIIITHRTDNMDLFNKVVRIEDGNILEILKKED